MTPVIVRYEGALVTAEIPAERFLWAVYESFHLVWTQADKMGTICIPRHFASNFASVPRLLWGFLPPWDSVICKAAVVHDFLYGTHDHTRAFADAILFHGMEPLGAKVWQRWLVWLAVRLFGARPWRNGYANQLQNIEAFQYLIVGAPLGTITICDDTLGYVYYNPLRNVAPTEYVTRRE